MLGELEHVKIKTRLIDEIFAVLPTFAFRVTENIHVVHYESIKRELKTRPTYECRYDERLKTIVEESTRLAYTGLLVELEHQG